MRLLTRLVIVILFCFSNQAVFSQNYVNMLQGSWVALKTSMKNEETQNINNSYLKFTFKGNHLHINIDPTVEVSNAPVPFLMKGKLIKTSRVSDSGYMIEKISADSLIIADSFETNAKRYYFVNQNNLLKENLIKHANEDSFIATAYCTPTQANNIYEPLYKILRGKIKSDFLIEGSIKLHLDEKKIETVIISEDLNNSKSLKKVTEFLNGTYEFWNLTHFEKFRTVEIPFIIAGQNVSNFESLRIQFL